MRKTNLLLVELLTIKKALPAAFFCDYLSRIQDIFLSLVTLIPSIPSARATMEVYESVQYLGFHRGNCRHCWCVVGVGPNWTCHPSLLETSNYLGRPQYRVKSEFLISPEVTRSNTNRNYSQVQVVECVLPFWNPRNNLERRFDFQQRRK
jgi:hypothetical protein